MRAAPLMMLMITNRPLFFNGFVLHQIALFEGIVGGLDRLFCCAYFSDMSASLQTKPGSNTLKVQLSTSWLCIGFWIL